MAESRIVVKMTELEPVKRALDEAARTITAERERADALAARVERLTAELARVRQLLWWAGHAHEYEAAQARGAALAILDRLLSPTPAPASAPESSWRDAEGMFAPADEPAGAITRRLRGPLDE